LDNAILCYFPQVFQQYCGWHLITCGWDWQSPTHGSASNVTNKPFNKIFQNILA